VVGRGAAIALADLDRFAAFLHERHPRHAQVIAEPHYSIGRD
jgi:hypothetical protein